MTEVYGLVVILVILVICVIGEMGVGLRFGVCLGDALISFLKPKINNESIKELVDSLICIADGCRFHPFLFEDFR